MNPDNLNVKKYKSNTQYYGYMAKLNIFLNMRNIFVHCNLKVAYCGLLCKVNCLLGAISDKEQDINDRNSFTKRENIMKLEIF